jgi:hypothetical protein
VIRSNPKDIVRGHIDHELCICSITETYISESPLHLAKLHRSSLLNSTEIVDGPVFASPVGISPFQMPSIFKSKPIPPVPAVLASPSIKKLDAPSCLSDQPIYKTHSADCDVRMNCPCRSLRDPGVVTPVDAENKRPRGFAKSIDRIRGPIRATFARSRAQDADSAKRKDEMAASIY